MPVEILCNLNIQPSDFRAKNERGVIRKMGMKEAPHNTGFDLQRRMHLWLVQNGNVKILKYDG
jgi:hypothetical protein